MRYIELADIVFKHREQMITNIFTIVISMSKNYEMITNVITKFTRSLFATDVQRIRKSRDDHVIAK